jgi:hypothetical protein
MAVERQVQRPLHGKDKDAPVLTQLHQLPRLHRAPQEWHGVASANASGV